MKSVRVNILFFAVLMSITANVTCMSLGGCLRGFASCLRKKSGQFSGAPIVPAKLPSLQGQKELQATDSSSPVIVVEVPSDGALQPLPTATDSSTTDSSTTDSSTTDSSSLYTEEIHVYLPSESTPRLSATEINKPLCVAVGLAISVVVYVGYKKLRARFGKNATDKGGSKLLTDEVASVSLNI